MSDDPTQDDSAEELRAEVRSLRARVARYERAEREQRAERAQFASERERLELIVESSNDGVWEWSLSRDEVWCSPRFEELLGIEGQPLTSAEAVLERVHPTDRDATRRAIRRCLRHGKPYRIKHRLRTDSRGYRWFLSRGLCQTDAEGRATRFAGSICDIDESLRGENALNRSNKTYQSLFETSREAIVITDLEGRIQDANKSLIDLLGYSLDELRELSYRDLTPSQWVRLDREAMEEIAEKGHAREFEKEYRHKDGRHIAVSIQTWRVEGEDPQLFAFVRDISSEQQLDAALQRSEDRLRIVADGLPARIVYIDRDLRMGFSNQRYRARYGLADEDITGRHLREVIGDDIYESVRLHVDSVLSGRPISFERREELPSGRTAYLHSAYEPVFSPEGEVEGFYALITDVSDNKRMQEALESSERRFRSLAGGAPVGVFECDTEGRMNYANRHWEEMTGYRIEDILGEGWIRIVHPDDIEYVRTSWQRSVEEGRECAIEWRVRRNDGELRWVVGRSKPVLDEYERIQSHVGMVLDVTDRRRAEEEAIEVAARLQTMADSVHVLIVFVDRELRYQFTNERHREWYGLGLQDVQGKGIEEILGGENYEAALPHIEAVLSGRPVEAEFWQTHADGKKRYLAASFRPQIDTAGEVTGYWVLAQDVTESKRDQDRIHRLAYFDPITDLPNRQSFRNALEEAVQSAREVNGSLGLLFLDVDRFKQINDTLGHRVGDAVLSEVGSRLVSTFRTSGFDEDDRGSVSRYGGDEFALVIKPPVSEQTVHQVANGILERLAEPFDVDGHTFGLSATVGFSLYPRDGHSADDLINKADAAMLQGKREGRARIVGYTASLDRTVRRHIALEARLRRAIDEGAFHVVYQLQRDAQSGALAGGEALLRWQDAELGEVSPGEFIPVAEEAGLIVPIGEWVFAHVCEQCKVWDDAGFDPVRMGVNLSARQLQESDLGSRLRHIVDAAELEPSRIELEITETALIDNMEQVMGVLEDLRANGFQLALDDFGTGYSSLSYLRQLPIDRVKIDQSFVSGIPGSESDSNLTSAIIAMAHKLRLRVIAEGVETQEQADFLIRQGCDELQGFLYGKGEPGHTFARRLRLAKSDSEA